MRKGELEDVHRSEGEEIGLRVFLGSKSASVASSDLSDEALGALVGRVLAMAGEAPEDPYAGLAPAELLMTGAVARPRQLGRGRAGSGGAAEPARWRRKARRSPSRASPTATAAMPRPRHRPSRSPPATAFPAPIAPRGHSCSASVVAGEGSAMQRDHAWHSARHAEDLEDPAEIGRRAGERAVARLGHVKLGAGQAAGPVRSARRRDRCSAISPRRSPAAPIARKSSFLQDKLGEQIFAKGVTIHRRPAAPARPAQPRLRRRGPAGAADGPRRRRRADHLAGDSADARQLGIQPTGHAVRGVSGAPGAGPSNLYIAAGTAQPRGAARRRSRAPSSSPS